MPEFDEKQGTSRLRILLIDRMKPTEQHRNAAEMLRFIATGVAATAVQYLTYFVLLSLTSENIAFTIGFIVSFLFNFVMTTLFTFRVSFSWRRFVGFASSHAVNYLVQLTLFNLFLWIGVPAKWAPLPVYAVAVPISFLLVRLSMLGRRHRHKDK